MKCIMWDNYNPEMCRFCSAWCPLRPSEFTISTNNIGTSNNNNEHQTTDIYEGYNRNESNAGY